MTDPAAAYESLREEISTVLVGNDDLIEHLTIALLVRGHVLLEGVPGIAKTTAANAFANATGLDHRRIQMTPDILPADITGTHVYREATGEFSLQRGPVFSNLVVADEINRATPKTQSALLEAMEEETVTIEGDTLSLPSPFMVIATQNPIEMEGTFELPEAQRDRFDFKLIVDLPDREHERELIDRFDDDVTLSADDVSRVLDADVIHELREQVAAVHVSEAVKEYVLDIVGAIRASDEVELGASPRASIAFVNAGKARAAIHGREYVTSEDVKALARPILRHRLVLSTEADLSERSPDDVVSETLSSVAAPSAAVASEST